MFTERFIVSSEQDDARTVQEQLLQALRDHGYDESACFAIRLATEEALINAVKHGNRNDPEKQVTLDCSIDERRIVIDIADEGNGFDPDTVPDPTLDENLSLPSGRGIVLMRSFMTRVEFNGSGNRVSMVYERTG